MPYIDPVTGAYVADSLDALPPGYNQPKAGNEANVAKMRATLNDTWENNSPIPNLNPPATDPISLIKQAYQHMPGAGMVQGAMPSIFSMPQILASLGYGVGNQVVNPESSNFNADTTKAMRAMQYTPPTQAGRDISEAIGKFGEAIGPLPELWVPQRGRSFTPDDLRVLAKTGIEDVRNFPSDYANAKAGITREYPTMGSRAAGATETAGTIAKPFVEPIYNQVMETGGFNVPGMPNEFNVPVASYAVKPKGGNWPTNLGSTDRLSTQGEFGMHLADTQISDPAVKWFENLPRQIKWDWDRFLQDKFVEHGGSMTPQQKQAYAEEFTKEKNMAREAEGQPLITLPSEFERIAPQFNSWVMGPYQKYITNQMGTGLSFDPLVQAFNETNLSTNDFAKMVGAPDYQPKSDIQNAETRRQDYIKNLTNYGHKNYRLEEPQNIDVGKQTATSPAGIAVENALDATLYPKGTYAFSSEEGYPYASKLSHDTIIHDFLNNVVNETTALPSIQKKVLNDLMAGNLDINKLSNLTPAVVARQIIKEELERQKILQSNKDAIESYRIARNKELPIDMPYEDGSQMVVFTKADYDKDPIMLTRDLSQITKDLHQCIGSGCHGTEEYPSHGPVLEPHTGKPPKGSKGVFKYPSYFEGLQKGTREIASLKNPQGVSEFTANIMVRGKDFLGNPTVHKGFVKNWIENEILSGKESRDNWQPILDSLDKNNNTYLHSVLESTPKLKEDFNKHFLPIPEKYITEMKGYDNGIIKGKYIPYIKEWLNQYPDLTRVDMDRLEGEIFDLRDLDSSNRILESKHRNWSSVAIENLLKDASDNNLLPRFFDDKEFEKLAEDSQVDLTEDPAYKGGNAPFGKAYTELVRQIHRQYEGVRESMWSDPREMESLARAIRENDSAVLGVELPYSLGLRNELADAILLEGIPNPNTPARGLEQMADAIQGMEPENAGEFEPPNRPEFPDALSQNMRDYFEGNAHNLPENMIEPYATETRILMGNQINPEARLPRYMHQAVTEMLLNQDARTEDIRALLNHLQTRGHQGLDNISPTQAENILEILINWTERYPLAE